MAVATTDYFIQPEDGWTLVATNPVSLLIKPGNALPWWVAITASGVPPAGQNRATGTVTFTGQPLNTETVTIDGRVYTFKTVLAAADDILIGATANDTAANLAAAINDSGVEGTNYGTGTTVNLDVTAAAVAGVVTLTAILPGTAGNAVTLAEAATNVAVSGATLTGGVNELIGVPMGKDTNDYDEPFEGASITGLVYIRIKSAVDASPGNAAHFAVITS